MCVHTKSSNNSTTQKLFKILITREKTNCRVKILLWGEKIPCEKRYEANVLSQSWI